MKRSIPFSKAINEAIHIAMEKSKSVICFGLGANDPKRIFGTTEGLVEKFGESRVFDMPTSENGMTGVGVGASLNGIRPIMIHQRLDFFLYALDQVVNSAAKWYFMFGLKKSAPITIRLIIGHGWGQGPTHSQNLQSWFAHIPGLKVVMPTSADDAKGLLLSSVFDENPVIFLEHRWLHNVHSEVPEEYYEIPIGKAKIVSEGSDITIVSYSYMTLEATHAAKVLKKYGISCEIVDLRTIRPLDWETVFTSVKKTGKLLALDSSSPFASVASEIVSRVCLDIFDSLKMSPLRITQPDYASPSSFGLTKHYYRGAKEIVMEVCKAFGVNPDDNDLTELEKKPHDVPGDWFKGPF
ncbi:alpha-ketoacid dehydrogenase subunit beta [Leptospira limi]|uniref:Alpha-ketoacid dehydrogenase subunit beta n=1 Tax=Leptospira limi TaxID=2950023 RepID=A0ABT3LZT8_9LEPT|nr:transketolase C-terminal domain-containing protein [Leptospira limi]MCW7462995.1 alpha-ketoacid dehydrogenase subunit beta [Leptospira limi]